MEVRSLARSAARRIAPGYMADRARRYERELRRREGVPDVAQRLLADGPAIVSGGPFAGLVYPDERVPEIDTAGAKLLGTYEREIAWVFERAIGDGVGTFVDIGCADGYYAVGMPHACRGTVSFAYDLAASARELCAATAAASGVSDRVRIAKRFTRQQLENLPQPALVLCDIEGAEVELLTAEVARLLGDSVVVIEVHEDERPGAGARLRDVFGNTHRGVTILQQPRSESPTEIADWPRAERARALREHRGPRLHWIVFEPIADPRHG